jgi:thioredoxin-related protein
MNGQPFLLRHRATLLQRTVLALVLCFGLAVAPLRAQQAQPQPPEPMETPAWFTETFLHMREDVRDAAKEGKRLLVYFGQDGCPYCKQLIRTNFTQPRIVETTRRHFVSMAINIWGDREVTWTDGRTMSEKEFARFLKIQFTPTILMLDEQGAVVARLNGYYPPHRFEAALDYVAGKLEKKQAFGEYMKSAVKEAASEQLHDEPFFIRPELLKRQPRGKPLMVLFETRHCSGCDELHREGFRAPQVSSQLGRFDVARIALGDNSPLTTPDGKRNTADGWARDLKVAYTPTMVFFDAGGREVFRVEAYMRPFHLASSLDYVASGGYRSEPSFQRFIQERAEKMRARGEPVDLWK